MSAAVVDGCFLSALQPNSSRTAYVVPSDGPCSDFGAKARRVQEQVRLRLAEKKSPSLGRLTTDDDDAAAATAVLGPAAATKAIFTSCLLFQCHDWELCLHKCAHPLPNGGRLRSRRTDVPKPRACEYALPSGRGFSSRSMIHTPSRIMAVSTMPSGGFSSRSAVETSSKVRASVAQQSLFQTHSARSRRTKSLCQAEINHHGVSGGNLVAWAPPVLRRTLSGTLQGSTLQGAAPPGGSDWADQEMPTRFTYKGPSHRTINRIGNRQQHGAAYGWGGALRAEGWGSQRVPQWHVHRPGHALSYQSSSCAQRAASASVQRAASVRSVASVGKGLDVLDGASVCSNEQLAGMQGLDAQTAVRYLCEPDAALQILGAAYIQHQCYHSRDSKKQVRLLQGVPALVQLFSSDNLEVLRFATGATRNLIYENTDNKVALVDAGGVARLVAVLGEPDEELRKNITGVLWNLSSRDNLKEKLCREALAELSSKVLIPLCASIPLSPSEKDIFNNATGCLRNLSSVNQRTREKMRDTSGLVDSLVSYIQQEVGADDKGLENSVCVLRNLSYQLYSELPHSVRLRLEGPARGSASRDAQAVGCFPMYGKKNVEQQQQRQQSLAIMSEASREARGAEWLWHPRVVALYKRVLQSAESTSAGREAAVGALQNLTAGDGRWAALLSAVVLEQERMLPSLLDLLDNDNEAELRPLSALLRNLARHAANKDLVAKNMVNVLVSKLPGDGLQKTPSSEVVVNICGALNHLVTCSSLAARDIAYFNGLPKLVGIKTSHDNSSGGLKASRAASTVLCNMFQYSKLHKDYKLKGFARRDFADGSV
ncbi:plakophilin-3-like isoform X2 [Syngnathus typhle]|uniref:plakophilin-3-like isoform X2 n=1 Tax=Syngnathus typhle TaxID=161592 RepID=UPI002A6A5E1B|nr:plakophilin-3-like isoform X2 [Syngnathus typhle]